MVNILTDTFSDGLIPTQHCLDSGDFALLPVSSKLHEHHHFSWSLFGYPMLLLKRTQRKIIKTITLTLAASLFAASIWNQDCQTNVAVVSDHSGLHESRIRIFQHNLLICNSVLEFSSELPPPTQQQLHLRSHDCNIISDIWWHDRPQHSTAQAMA